MLDEHNIYNEEFFTRVKIWPKKVSNNQPVHADIVVKEDGPFYCPDTFEELIVRKCTEKINHFAYKGRLSAVYGSRESKLHLQCKEEICKILKKSHPTGSWEVERPIPENKSKGIKKLIPDISGRINGKPIVIEVQASSLTLPKIIERTIGYYTRGVSVLWIVPLKEALGDELYRPRLYERYLHSIYFGRIYYWQKGNGTSLTPVHLSREKRWIEESHWFDEDGTERTEGGYYKDYKTIFRPDYGSVVDIKNFISEERLSFVPENEEKAIPQPNI